MNGYIGWLGPVHNWVLAAHVTFVIFWMAGLFLLPRFYVYHQEAAVGSPDDRAWIEREARVRSIILTPAMIAVWILGLMLAFDIGAWTQGWFHAKRMNHRRRCIRPREVMMEIPGTQRSIPPGNGSPF